MKHLLIAALVCAAPCLNAMSPSKLARQEREFQQALKDLREQKSGKNIVESYYDKNYTKAQSLIQSTPTLKNKQSEMLLNDAYSEGLVRALPDIIKNHKAELEKMTSKDIGEYKYYDQNQVGDKFLALKMAVSLTEGGFEWYPDNRNDLEKYADSVVDNINELTEIIAQITPAVAKKMNVNLTQQPDSYLSVIRKYYDPIVFQVRSAAAKVKQNNALTQATEQNRNINAKKKFEKQAEIFGKIATDLNAFATEITEARENLNTTAQSTNIVK